MYNDKVILAFVTYTRTVDLMNATGLSKQTIVKYKKDEKLKKLVDDYRGQILRESLTKMQMEVKKNVETLVKIRDDDETPPQAKINACNSLMSHCKDWTIAIDVLNRLQALESSIDES